ncbi:glycosyltransferase [Synechococcus sp. UW140]|uniref:glycosyltransferase family 2 protein n=1 Tax=Synechococcus sp. UW140 TaxID=368503 RepID=UPI003137C396
MTHEAPPLFSVVIPTYNHGKYLCRCLQSVLDQTYTNWEAIVVDNHSTDDTEDVVNSFTDERFTYVKVHNNGIIAVSRNVGIKAAKGEWIAFLDSDDWWTSNKLNVCLNYINNTVDLLYHDLVIVSNHSWPFINKFLRGRQLKPPVLIDLLVAGNAISNSSVVVRKKLLDDINGINESRELIAAEDYNTWLRIAQVTEQFYYISQSLGFYLSHSQNMSGKDMSLPRRYAVSAFVNILTHHQLLRLEASLRYTSGRFNYISHFNKLAIEDLLIALNHSPLRIKFKILFMLIRLFVFR